MSNLLNGLFSSHLHILIVVAVVAVAMVLIYFAVREKDSAINKTGIIVPLFTSPSESSDWETVIKMKQAHPSVPIIAIINPSSGSGMSKLDDISSATSDLKSAGIKVVGYVATGYSWRSHDEVTMEIKNYMEWYGVDGIFFDEVSHWEGREGYYRDAVDFTNRLNRESITIGNPGVDAALSYAGIFDILVIYESYGIPSPEKLDDWYDTRNKSRLAVFSFGIESLDSDRIMNITDNIGWLFVTQGGMPNPWDALPSYFNSLVALVEHSQKRPYFRTQ